MTIIELSQDGRITQGNPIAKTATARVLGLPSAGSAQLRLGTHPVDENIEQVIELYGLCGLGTLSESADDLRKVGRLSKALAAEQVEKYDAEFRATLNSIR